MNYENLQLLGAKFQAKNQLLLLLNKNQVKTKEELDKEARESIEANFSGVKTTSEGPAMGIYTVLESDVYKQVVVKQNAIVKLIPLNEKEGNTDYVGLISEEAILFAVKK